MRSLRARLVALIVAVTGTALVAAALLSRVAVRREYLQMESTDRVRGLAPVVVLVEERIRQWGPAGASDSLLARLGESAGRPLLLADTMDRVIAASSAPLRAATLRRSSDGAIELTVPSRHGDATVLRRLRFIGLPDFAIHGPGGVPVGRLYLLPREAAAGGGEAREPGFLLAVNRWLLAVAIGAGALAALLAITLLRRVLKPIEALTAAVRRLEAGDLAHRVQADSDDEIGELGRAFNAMAESVARNETLRRGLVTDVAHELRTPLTHLRGQIEALQDGLVSPDAATIRSLHEETLLLGRLVDDLQELALAEAGQLPLHRTAVAVGPLVASALAAVAASARERHVTLESGVSAALPPVDADPARLAQVLRNLLANALTHSRQGGRISVLASPDPGGVAFVVQDDGAGIAPEHLPHVFERFYRADPSRSRTGGSAGLGLAIVRQLALAHAGSVRVESSPGQGARFTVVFPAARSS